jgi:hypothetical protein
MAFWKNIKQGYDHFEVTRLEPKVDVCERRYVFNGTPERGAFSPAGACPTYTIPDDIQTAVNDKQRQDEFQTAQLISRGTSTAPIKTGADGGMHPVFLAKLRPGGGSLGEGGARAYTPVAAAPGTIPAHAVPPRQSDAEVVTASTPAQPSYRVASADPASTPAPTNAGSSGNLFGNLFSSDDKPKAATNTSGSGNVLERMGRWIGLRGSETPAQPAPTPKPRPAVVRSANASPGAIRPKQPEQQPAEAPRASPGAIAARPPAPVPVEQKPAAPAVASALAGSTPIVPTSSFDQRWSAFR